jgi:hypothetical protein
MGQTSFLSFLSRRGRDIFALVGAVDRVGFASNIKEISLMSAPPHILPRQKPNVLLLSGSVSDR